MRVRKEKTKQIRNHMREAKIRLGQDIFPNVS